MAEAEGPLRHNRNLAEYLRQYDVKDVTAQRLLPDLRGTVVVDDVSVLAPPKGTREWAFRARQNNNAVDLAAVEFQAAAGGSYVEMIDVATPSNVRLFTNDVPRISVVNGTIGPADWGFAPNGPPALRAQWGFVPVGAQPNVANGPEIGPNDLIGLVTTFYIPAGKWCLVLATSTSTDCILANCRGLEVPAPGG